MIEQVAQNGQFSPPPRYCYTKSGKLQLHRWAASPGPCSFPMDFSLARPLAARLIVLSRADGNLGLPRAEINVSEVVSCPVSLPAQ